MWGWGEDWETGMEMTGQGGPAAETWQRRDMAKKRPSAGPGGCSSGFTLGNLGEKK